MVARLTSFPGMPPDDASRFAERWLPAWTGGDADRLIAFYAPDAFYRDPYVTDGLTGTAAIKQYFARLLARNPDWVWTQTAAVPLESGFLNFWHARIPTGGSVAHCDGVCTVVLDDDGLIRRNEVFFDPTPLIQPHPGS